ncbi:hypothetical protein [Longimicrobium sp.]|uniref:YncE family protein n=1 Tax=Longimicrobium sp. TaxID=2029185 RepID=UPI002CC0A00A|nr:hypothetical protein [Longimicrobium sp.]HSU14027.1 hypothetical protein [Longimicrobium sp.]
MTNESFRRLGRLAVLSLAATLAACSGGDGPGDPGGGGAPERVEVIVNSVSRTLSILSPDSASPVVRTVELGSQGSPVAAAVRGGLAVVPMGTYPFAVVVDLRTGVVTHTVALPANSGATGAAFLNDSIVMIANPNRNTVSPVNAVTGTIKPELAVGTYPQTVVPGPDVVFVLNANLVNFAPAGPGSVSVITAANKVDATASLQGINPTAGVVSGARLFIVNAGHFGGNDGTLSVLNLATATEEVFTGFGEFPGSVDVGVSGNVYVGVYGTGILEWNPGVHQFVRGLDNPIVPAGGPPVSAVAVDYAGRLHTLNPGSCNAPGKEYRLVGSTANRTVTTGVCPFDIKFTQLAAPTD